ncbi:MAG: hypothetical protein KatS3mg114_0101 [Planctomycetaceae bacterium]|nr:MAG: hypothetical protein KatS3mg114_0101 [Planctomycetaceae bacterium]
MQIDSFALDTVADVDLIEEMRLRTWARRNYRPPAQRDSRWHPIILDEMQRMDDEECRSRTSAPHN